MWRESVRYVRPTARDVFVTFRGAEIEVPAGTTIAEFLKRYGEAGAEKPLGALLNNRLVGLDCQLLGQTDLKLVTYRSREGAAIYRRSVALLLFEAARDLYPKARVVIGQSISEGYYFDLLGIGTPVDEAVVASLEKRMAEIVAEDRPIVHEATGIEEVVESFRREGDTDKLELLATWRSPFVHVVKCGRFRDIAHGPFAPSTGCLGGFDLIPHPPGLVLRFPDVASPETRRPFIPQPKLFQIYRETREWNEILGVKNVGSLNRHCLDGSISEIIKVAEGFHEKKIAKIADEIVLRRPTVQIVLIAGPSASGKTTFAKRLSIQLLVVGIRPVALSLDNYYIDRERTPRDEAGKPDFEALEALDLDLFNRQLVELLAGKEVRTPVFDFQTGTRRPERDWVPMRLEHGQVLLIEGIHGLNDRLTAAVPAERKYKIYVSALTQLAIDDHNRIFTSDSRLLRRIVRDRMFRGFTAARTISMWPSVRRGEERHIFPFQENADVMFNSALVYEPALLKPFAERFLLEVPPQDPAFTEAYRLLRFLGMFVTVFRDEVPQTSILREFIGGSSFQY